MTKKRHWCENFVSWLLLAIQIWWDLKFWTIVLYNSRSINALQQKRFWDLLRNNVTSQVSQDEFRKTPSPQTTIEIGKDWGEYRRTSIFKKFHLPVIGHFHQNSDYPFSIILIQKFSVLGKTWLHFFLEKEREIESIGANQRERIYPTHPPTF